MTDFRALPPIGAVVQKRCTCGHPAQHREVDAHPRYRVVDIIPNPYLPPPMKRDALLYSDARLERLDTKRVHRTSMLLLCNQYVIVSLPTKAVLL